MPDVSELLQNSSLYINVGVLFPGKKCKPVYHIGLNSWILMEDVILKRLQILLLWIICNRKLSTYLAIPWLACWNLVKLIKYLIAGSRSYLHLMVRIISLLAATLSGICCFATPQKITVSSNVIWPLLATTGDHAMHYVCWVSQIMIPP